MTDRPSSTEFACWVCAEPLRRDERGVHVCTACGEAFPDICEACAGPFRADVPSDDGRTLCEPCRAALDWQ